MAEAIERRTAYAWGMALIDNQLRILVPLDDSWQAQRVLVYATALATRMHARLKLIRATDVEDDTSFNSLAYIAKRLCEAGISVESSVVGGVDAETAIHAAETEWQPDLIALATTKSSQLDRWLNGSVTESVIRSAGVPVLLVPPELEQPPPVRERIRIVVPLDGSHTAEQAAWFMVRLSSIAPFDLTLLRAVHAAEATDAAERYLQKLGASLQSALPMDREVAWHTVTDHAADAIIEMARQMDMDGIAMSTRGHSLEHPGLIAGRVTTTVVVQAPVPLILLGPGALARTPALRITLGSQVRTRDDHRLGEVHRMLVDLTQRAVVGIVVLSRSVLARDILVPLDFIESAGDDEVQLRLTREQFSALPDFAYREYTTPPPTWTVAVPAFSGPTLTPGRQRERLGPAQVELLPDTRVIGPDGDVGRVDRLEADLHTGRLTALWIRADGVFKHDIRIPVEKLNYADDQRELHLTGTLPTSRD
jgi:nucleotide-binding universal stress UspA family protein